MCPTIGLVRPAVALAEDRESATVGVGNSAPGVSCSRISCGRLGRRLAPAEGDRLEPALAAVGVGSSGMPPRSSSVGRLLR
jgi:hypothetical protein